MKGADAPREDVRAPTEASDGLSELEAHPTGSTRGVSFTREDPPWTDVSS